MSQRELNQAKLKQAEQTLKNYRTQYIDGINYLDSWYTKQIQERAIQEQKIKQDFTTTQQQVRELNREWIKVMREKDTILSKMDITLKREDERVNKFSQKATQISSVLQYRNKLQKQRIGSEARDKYLQIIEAQQSNFFPQ